MDTDEKGRLMCKKHLQETAAAERDNVIEFPNTDTLEKYAEDVKNMILAKAGKVAVLIKCEDGFVYNNYWGCGVGDMFEFAGHIHLDAVNKSFRATYALESKPE
jgi:hypothetical protein